MSVDSSTFSGECVVYQWSKLRLKPSRYCRRPAPIWRISSSGVMPSASAFSMMGAPCVSSAPTKCTGRPCMRWKRTQMSAWMYSMMWPMWNGPFENGSAVVMNSGRREAMARMIADSPPSAIRDPRLTHVFDGLELRLVDAFLVRVLAADRALVEQFLDRAVHGPHAVRRAALHRVFQLVELALTDQVRDGGGVHHDLQSGDAAGLAGTRQQLLGDHAAQ